MKWVVSSHEHEDHVGALAELQRRTGAKVAAIAEARAALESGKPGADDPQLAIAKPFAPIKVDRVVPHGEALVVGPLRLTASSTPAHSAGSASWTWRSCAGDDCRTMTYADSATVISAEGYRFRDHPERVTRARAGLAAIGGLPCGVLMTPHPGASALFDRLAGQAPLDDPHACHAYAEAAATRLAARLASEGEAAQ